MLSAVRKWFTNEFSIDRLLLFIGVYDSSRFDIIF